MVSKIAMHVVMTVLFATALIGSIAYIVRHVQSAYGVALLSIVVSLLTILIVNAISQICITVQNRKEEDYDK